MVSSYVADDIPNIFDHNYAWSFTFLFKKDEALSKIDIDIEEDNFSQKCKPSNDKFLNLDKHKCGKIINSNIIYFSSISQSSEISKQLYSLSISSSNSTNKNTTIIS